MSRKLFVALITKAGCVVRIRDGRPRICHAEFGVRGYGDRPVFPADQIRACGMAPVHPVDDVLARNILVVHVPGSSVPYQAVRVVHPPVRRRVMKLGPVSFQMCRLGSRRQEFIGRVARAPASTYDNDPGKRRHDRSWKNLHLHDLKSRSSYTMLPVSGNHPANNLRLSDRW